MGKGGVLGVYMMIYICEILGCVYVCDVHVLFKNVLGMYILCL